MSDPPREGSIVEARVERMAYGGDGVARPDGLVVFVPWTAPGDRIRATLVERRASWARARLDEVLEEGPDRVAPGCPVFGVCGGCQIQHLSPPAQRSAKARAVADAFERIARRALEPEPVCEAAAEPWHYRQRVVLTWRRTAEGLALGFHAAEDPTAVVPIHACPIFAEAGNRALGPLCRGLAVGLEPDDPGEGRLMIRALPGEGVQAGVFAPDVEAARRLAGLAAAQAGVPVTWGTWKSEGGPLSLAADAPRLEARFDYRELNLRVGFDSFLQADLDAAEALYDAALEALHAEPGESVIDGYAGIGVVACHLASKGVKVTAVEAHPGAASDLRANAARVLAAGRPPSSAHSRLPQFGRRLVLLWCKASKNLSALALSPFGGPARAYHGFRMPRLRASCW
ncbi:MAG: hypothetical protein KY397_03410 [Gemmatimonadetes bacterium]|nr:hypothetical protein [Gemmatimonadota bacterium]